MKYRMNTDHKLLPGILLALFLWFPLAEAQQIIRLSGLEYGFHGLKLTRTSGSDHPKIGLVLSGGGARGLAQIGVLRALEKHRIPIDFIAGNSMGSVVGGLYASGYSTAQLESLALQTNWDEVLSFSESTQRNSLFVKQKQSDQAGYLTIRFDGLEPIIPSSVSSGQRLLNFFMDLTLQSLYHPDPTFDNLKIPYRAVAVDLIKGKRAIIDHGSLAEAMRSSITVPLLYAPMERDSMALVDGGLLSNVPVDVADSAGCDIVIAVNSASGLRTADQMQAPWEIADQILTIVMQEPNIRQLQQADVVITPEVGNRLVTDFHDIDSLIREGERATEEKLRDIENRIRSKILDESSLSDSVLTNVSCRVVGQYVAIPDREALMTSTQRGRCSIQSIRRNLYELLESGRYLDAYAEIERRPDSTIVQYHVQAAPLIQSVEFTGNNRLRSEVIRSVVQELVSTPFDYTAIQSMLESVVTLYRNEQYALARIMDVRLSPAGGTVRFTIDEGVINDIVCEGNTEVKDYVIRREFPFDVGDLFRTDEVKAGLSNVIGTGLFEYAFVEIHYYDGKPTIVLKVKEKSTEIVRMGFHADDEHSLLGNIELRDANFRGAGEDLSLGVRYGYRDRNVRLEYRANRIFNTYLTFDFRGYFSSRDVFTYRNQDPTDLVHWERIENGKYRETKTGGSFSFGTQLARFGDVLAEIRTERQRIAGISGEGYDNVDYRFVGLKLQTTLDTENKFVFPTEGIYFALSYESAMKSLGSEVSFTKISAAWSAYHTLFTRHTLHPRVIFGFADKTLPLPEQYSWGGLHSFYGLHEDDRRGRQIFISSLEYRYALPFKLVFDTYVSARYDLGTISLLPEALKFNQFRHALGLQVGIDTPVGAVIVAAGKSFYFLKNVENSPLSSGPVLFYFSIGPAL